MTLQERYILNYIQKFNNQSGQNYPCSNQIVRNIIWVYHFDQIVEDYLKSHNAIKAPRYNKYNRNYWIIDGEEWSVVRASNHARGYRAYKAIIDIRIPMDILQTIVIPCCNLYCCQMAYFGGEKI